MPEHLESQEARPIRSSVGLADVVRHYLHDSFNRKPGPCSSQQGFVSCIFDGMYVRKMPLQRDRVRDLNTFQPYPEFPIVPPVQLDSWLSAVTVKAVSALEWEWSRHWTIEARVLGDSMYFWFERGSGIAWFREPSNVYRFEKGDLLLIPQGVEHAIEGTADEEPHVFAVHFYANLFGGIDLLKMIGFPLLLPNRKSSTFKRVSERLVREYAVKAPGWSSVMSSEINSLLIHMIRTEANMFRPLGGIGFESELPRLLPVLDWIDRHLSSSEITVGDMADQIYLSETHFRRLFHKVFGASPVQFVRKRRIERACVLLRSTDSPIKQIANECGFAEEAFFSRVFHRLVGNSPAAYRKLEML